MSDGRGRPPQPSMPPPRASVPMRGSAHVRKLGRYVLAKRLASGGFANVYLAVTTGPGGFEKTVAIKQLHAHLCEDPQYIALFLDEARIAASITHPNVCTVHDFGEADGELYLAMEFIAGEPLSRLLEVARASATRIVSFPLIAYVIAEVAEGLHAAHEATSPDGASLNVVHRDVAPSNLYVTYDGHVKVLDFGVAKAIGTQKTATGVIKGHLAYVAPEQLAGSVDRRSDVFALGSVAWELLTLRPLFKRADDLQTLHAIQQGVIVSPRTYDATIPEPLERVVMQMLERDPGSRPATAREVADALRGWLRSAHPEVDARWVSREIERMFPTGRADKRALILEARSIANEWENVDFDDPTEVDAHPGPHRVDSTPPKAEKPARRWPIAVAITLAIVLALGVVAWVARGDDGASSSDAPAQLAR